MSGARAASTPRDRSALRAACACAYQAIDSAHQAQDGAFEALGHVPAGATGATVALIHGAVAIRGCPLVHVHAACPSDDPPGAATCGCRAELESAVGRMVSEGAGVVLYFTPDPFDDASCAREQRVDARAASALLRGAGVRSLRLMPHSDQLAGELRVLGLDVCAPEPDASR